MKNIVICCDGTSNDFGHENSNVIKLYSVLEKNTKKQVVYYDPGVGTPSTYDAFNPITRLVKRALGKGFGYGLSDNITEAYAFLMNTYEEGDQIYCFGFSRGAYTVRALAGLIDTCGLLHANSDNLIPEAMRIYHDRTLRDIAMDFKKTFARNCPIHLLGLWDTVSSVGWVYNPVTLQATTNNESVRIVRHAISIDERRAFFRQNLWGSRYQNTQDVKQVWFAGVHSDIGGSYPLAESGLSNITLEWMLAEAGDKGLRIGDEQSAREMVNKIPTPHLADQHNSLRGFWPTFEVWPKIVRIKKTLPEGGSKWISRLYINWGRMRFMNTHPKPTLHESVLLRLRGRPDYRPKNLMKICPDIAAITEHFPVEKWRRL